MTESTRGEKRITKMIFDELDFHIRTKGNLSEQSINSLVPILLMMREKWCK